MTRLRQHATIGTSGSGYPPNGPPIGTWARFLRPFRGPPSPAQIQVNDMTDLTGASVVVVGGGVTGLSAGWWLARSGVDVLVLDKGIVGWEASGRNGGGASHYHSPLFHEEQRLWPLMDELLGYTTEYRRERVVFATNQLHFEQY